MTLKDKIRHNFWGAFSISLLHCLECKLVPMLTPDEKAVKRFYHKSTGKELNLENPVSFAEKLNWYKLNGRKPLMQQCADKVAVREYVTSKGLGRILNEVYGVYNKVSQIDLNALPERFVLKAAHGSHMGIVVKDKSKVNWFQQKLMMWTWLHQDIAWSGREWVYKDMPKRIIAEKYLEDESGELRDYKFFCFNGKPIYMQYDAGRFSGHHSRNYYDMEKNLLHLSDDLQPDTSLEFPLTEQLYSQMSQLAAMLSEPFQFVRVDFYLVNGKIYFGELTFFHNGGITWFKPPEWDTIFGSHWTLVYDGENSASKPE